MLLFEYMDFALDVGWRITRRYRGVRLEKYPAVIEPFIHQMDGDAGLIQL